MFITLYENDERVLSYESDHLPPRGHVFQTDVGFFEVVGSSSQIIPPARRNEEASETSFRVNVLRLVAQA